MLSSTDEDRSDADSTTLTPFWRVPEFVYNAIYNLYLITVDDSPTFVVPNTVFGVSAAFTGSMLIRNDDGKNPTASPLLWKMLGHAILRTVLFNWANLLIFDLANQRQASIEDKLNKPWRPIPSDRMTAKQMRYWLIVALPLVLSFSHFCLRVGAESSILAILTWIYNDLGAGDDNWILRNLVIACAFKVYNMGSLKVAASSMPVDVALGHPVRISNLGYTWVLMISGVIFTTMHVQDLKDVAGDRARGRRSAPIVFGRVITGWSIAVPVVFWSIMCVRFWTTHIPIMLVCVVFGVIVAWRCVRRSGRVADRLTWQLWCAWTAVLYIIPPLSVWQ
ncbi:UbiA prenyltransferase family-domain-containing protein [Massariosphaeria phaeospora]|uniref:UbiA prenyltransferase family-domain-containing protein n=1 Tax=Massariosphaeria phaeospora TaxID=100035 RepID=A0A7C8M6F5_9PLEO|nr:UbiA prenyltransferase family-domain-containing protein [Massariosphaeria phaeospora]